MPQGGLEALQSQDPGEVLAYQYDLVCNGVELSSGAVRNHLPEVMEAAFAIAGYGPERIRESFPALWNAFHYGPPPHAGIAPGFDRILMLLEDQANLREVIAFPLNQAARDLLMGAPGRVHDSQLQELGIRLVDPPPIESYHVVSCSLIACTAEPSPRGSGHLLANIGWKGSQCRLDQRRWHQYPLQHRRPVGTPVPEWKPVDRLHLDNRGPVTPDRWNAFAGDLLGRLGGDISAKGRPTWVAVHQPDDGPSGALAIHESETELMGWTAPPDCAAVGVVAAGRVVDYTRSGSDCAALRITLCCLVARDGRLGWSAAPMGAVPATPPEEGRVVDCLRRCMGLPTFPPPSGPEILLDVMWLHEVDRVAGGRVGSPLSWDDVRGLHPAANDPGRSPPAVVDLGRDPLGHVERRVAGRPGQRLSRRLDGRGHVRSRGSGNPSGHRNTVRWHLGRPHSGRPSTAGPPSVTEERRPRGSRGNQTGDSGVCHMSACGGGHTQEGSMHRMNRLVFLCLTAIIAMIAATGAHASAQTPIKPGQHFVGLVNGSDNDPVVYTVCPGPAFPGETGRLLAGQTLAVAEIAQGAGYTGFFSSIHAWFVPTSVTPVTLPGAPPSVTFSRYGTPKRIPASVRVPCDGTGQVEFSSCPYLAPCAAGWVPDYVTVTFENVAV